MIDTVAGVQPLSVTIVNKKEAIVKLKEDNSGRGKKHEIKKERRKSNWLEMR